MSTLMVLEEADRRVAIQSCRESIDKQLGDLVTMVKGGAPRLEVAPILEAVKAIETCWVQLRGGFVSLDHPSWTQFTVWVDDLRQWTMLGADEDEWIDLELVWDYVMNASYHWDQLRGSVRES